MPANTVARYGNGSQVKFEVPGSLRKVVFVNGVLTVPASQDFQSVTLSVAPGVGVPIEIDYDSQVGSQAGATAALDTNGGLMGLVDPKSGSVIALSTVVGLSTLNTPAAATSNVVAIQAALTAGGLVQINTPGTYYINATLQIGDNTKFVLGPNVVIRLAANVHSNMLVNSAFLTASTAVTLAWTSGNLVSVNWPNHGLSFGQFVSLWGAAVGQPAYTGVFPITTITDANNFVVAMVETPTAVPTGAVSAVKANFNFSVEGGTWNYDWANQQSGAPDNYQLHAIVIFSAARFTFTKQVYQAVPKYNLCVASVRDYEITHQHALDGGLLASAHTGDILKVYGPSFNGRTGNFSGLCTDDIVSLQTQDSSVYVRYQPIATGGSIIGHTIYSVGGTEGAGGGGTVSLYCPPNGYAWTYTNISCDGLFNGAVSAQYKVRIGGDSAAGNYGCAAGNITFKNVNLQNSGLSSVFHMDQYCYVKSLTFEDCFISSGGMTRAQDAMVFYGKIDMLNLNRVAGDTLQSVISTNGTSLIDVLNFNGCSQRNCIGLYVPNGGTCNIVNFIGCTIAGVASGVSFVYPIAATTVKEINLIGCNVSGGTGSASFVQLDSMLVGVKISFLNCHLNALKIVGCSVTSAVVDVCLSGCVVDGASNGLVRNDAACTFNITSGGGNSFINSSVPAAVGGGVLTLGLYGWDLPYDVITGIANITLATANGQFIKSTRVGATNLGPAVKAPAGWVALGTGASGANTVIA